MRRRWDFNPGPYAAVWIVAGLVGFIVTSALTNPCDQWGCGMNSGRQSTAATIVLALWVGPFVLAIAVAVLVACVWAVWYYRPRRISEPVTTDLREASSDR